MGLKFAIDMTWGRLILFSLSEKRPKNQSPDTRGTGKLWLSQCTVAPAAFLKCVFWDTLYVNHAWDKSVIALLNDADFVMKLKFESFKLCLPNICAPVTWSNICTAASIYI